MKRKEDKSMASVRKSFKQSGMTMHELGMKMGYSESTARKSVSQFLKTADPSIGMLRRFAKAMEIDVKDLL
jgi:transcriptional regulator with XRE-family HTH domain